MTPEQAVAEALYDREARRWVPRCPYGDTCTGCDAAGICSRAPKDWRLVATAADGTKLGVDEHGTWWARFPFPSVHGRRLCEVESMTVEYRKHEAALVTGLVLTGKTRG